jgi:hypothetical protein
MRGRQRKHTSEGDEARSLILLRIIRDVMFLKATFDTGEKVVRIYCARKRLQRRERKTERAECFLYNKVSKWSSRIIHPDCDYYNYNATLTSYSQLPTYNTRGIGTEIRNFGSSQNLLPTCMHESSAADETKMQVCLPSMRSPAFDCPVVLLAFKAVRVAKSSQQRGEHLVMLQ